jgi:long-chain fatty acid transport protein
MTKTIKLALVAAMAMGATSAFATNGDNLIGLGAKSRAMGGTGIAHANGAESATSNPALITKNVGTNIAFGGTYFSADVEVDRKNASVGGAPVSDNQTSQADDSVIPYVAITEELGDGFYIGVSMFGSAGMGTDWRNQDMTLGANLASSDVGLYAMRSNLMLMKFSVPIAYETNGFSIGFAPVLMYGALDVNYNTFIRDQFGVPVVIDGSLASKSIGSGSSTDYGMGYELGLAYELSDMGLTVGAKYQSAIEMEYRDQISDAAGAFGYGSNPNAMAAYSDKLEQPAEYGFGIDWTEGDFSVTADYKRIEWGEAEGYKDFGWENQNVYALGAEYRMDDLAIRIGYNYAKNPIKNNTSTQVVANSTVFDGTGASGNTDGDTMNTFNHVMFPAITERHYTIGAGYQFTKNIGADVAFTYATSPDVTVSGATVGVGELTVSNDQMSFSGNLNYAF